MIAPAPTRTIVKQLKKAGFTPQPGKGSHEKFVCPSGRHTVSVPTGHSTISPGVRRQVDATIAACDC
ncbi:type II toxin-antitoxin system HicA family toxin [Williamsia deligens]|uniref:Type II toxin-antitoxin system HicA family toxin n=1 Tax=Williamsia deligens TaxID=321325 RepID=A0ABW3G0D3_9NOCA|nr:type II toxin-antitoxin system HicA family toxin [Williamsia deligens]MCP2195105.1 HicA toxin of toxin-antitoxin [Williamsia deligens]